VKVYTSFWLSFVEPTVVVKETEKGALTYRLLFQNAFDDPFKAYHLVVKTLSCSPATASSKFTGLVEFGVPSNEDFVTKIFW
jgi:hypothetical protein